LAGFFRPAVRKGRRREAASTIEGGAGGAFNSELAIYS